MSLLMKGVTDVQGPSCRFIQIKQFIRLMQAFKLTKIDSLVIRISIGVTNPSFSFALKSAGAYFHRCYV